MPLRPPPNRIMIIDDSAVVRRIIEGILIRDGYLVDSFNHGPEAMQALSNHQVHVPDLVLLDIQLPYMDGYSVAKLFRQNRGLDQTSIVMISGNDGMLDKVRWRMVGAKAYINKPFKPGEVLNVVHNILTAGEHPVTEWEKV
jgi:twitching motility two-component system response regulator PilG